MHTVKLDKTARRGLTLVELLVAMGIILVLAGIGVYSAWSFRSQQQVGNGSDRVQGWLLVARQKALRDQVPRGIRLLLDNNGYATQLQYIEKVDDFKGGTITIGTAVPSGTSSKYPITLSSDVDVTGGYGAGSPGSWAIQPNDILEILGTSSLRYFITQVQAPTATQPATITVTTPNTNPVPALSPTSNYRIIRAPRPLTGEATLELPDNIIIDVSRTHVAYGSMPALDLRGNCDILFAPSGAVIAPGGVGAYANNYGGKIILWVRDLGTDPNVPLTDRQGEQRLIVIYTRTGFIASHPVDPTNNYANPYSFANDGQGSGL